MLNYENKTTHIEKQKEKENLFIRITIVGAA